MKENFTQLLLSSRPVSWINTMYPFAATYLVLAGKVDAVFIIGSLYFLIPYNLLMYGINDVFDYESDLRNKRKKGMEGITLQPKLHRLTIISAVLLNAPFVIALFYYLTPPAPFILALVIFAVIAYSVPVLRFKERPFLDSATSSVHFVGPMAVAAAAAGSELDVIWPYLLAFFLWGVASHAFGAVQDINADREAHIGSIATTLGSARTVDFSIILYGTSSLLLLAQQMNATTVIGLVILMYLLNILPFRGIKDKDSENANIGWRRFIYLNYFMGFIITIVLILTFF